MSKVENSQPGKKPKRSRDLRSGDFPILTGSDDKSRCAYVTAIYEWAVAKGEEAIDWYLVYKQPKKWGARGTRTLAVVFVALGGLLPTLSASNVLPKTYGIDYSQCAFISLALAGACIGLDRFCGFSTGWMRYLNTAMSLEKLLQEFYLDWAINCACHDGQSAAQVEPMLRRVQTFLLRIRAELDKETAEWATEYRANLAEMEKSAREQLQASRPGSINLTVSNAAQAVDGVTVLLDGAPVQTTTTPDCQLAPVFPGDHVILIRGTVKGKEVIASAHMRVDPGKSLPLLLTLPED
jgi:hypothetical protein